MPSLLDVLGCEPEKGCCFLPALVGGGGKTTALFALAGELSEAGARVLVSTTTKIKDPRAEGRRVDVFLEASELLAAGMGLGGQSSTGGHLGGQSSIRTDVSFLGTELSPYDDPEGQSSTPAEVHPRGQSCIAVLSAGLLDGKLIGIDPSLFPALSESGNWDAILVEADGAKMRPLKAPAPYEPVWPAGVAMALGVVGLDCLDRPLDDRTVHRPELLGPLVGLEPGGTIRLDHILRLARHPEGLFRSAPTGLPRVLILNKCDLRPDLDPASLAARTAEALTVVSADLQGASSGVGLVLVCSLSDPVAARRVRAFRSVPGPAVSR